MSILTNQIRTLARPLAAICLFHLITILSNQIGAEEWHRLRGENGLGVVAKCNVPLPWSDSDVAWKIELPGGGNGSPVVYSDTVFVLSANEKTAERMLTAFDLADGTMKWERRFEGEPYRYHRRSSYASCTPCVTDDAIFVTWASPDNVVLMALTHDGKDIWQRDLGSYISQHGYGASPAVFDDTVILFNSQQADQLPPGADPGVSRVTAFDAKSGKTKWETTRTATRACYGLPFRFQDEQGRDAILMCNTGDGLFALNLKDGTPLWNKKVLGKRSVSSPMIVGDLAIGSEGSGGGGNILWGVSVTGDHDVKLKIDRSAPYVPSPVAKNDLLFLWGDKGIVSCIQLPSGDTVWSKRIGGDASTSPVIAGDKLVGIAEDGTVTILSASTEFEEIGSIELEETTRATPLISENFMLIRTDKTLFCVGSPS